MGGGKGGGSAPTPPDYQALAAQQAGINTAAFQQQLNAGRVNQTGPTASTNWTAPTTPGGAWSQSTQLTGPAAAVNSGALGDAAALAGNFNPNTAIPTYNGPGASAAGMLSYGGPTSSNFNYNGPGASATSGLSFNPAQVAQSLYQGQMGLLEPGMKSQSDALDNSLKAQGYDVNSAGGAQTAENNLQNQQNLVRTQAAASAEGQAIPQGAQALAAQESIPALQQSLAQGQLGGQLSANQGNITTANSSLQALEGILGLGSQLGTTQFNTGVQSAELPGQLAAQWTQTGMAPTGQLPSGSAQTPGLQPVDVMGAAQQTFANQTSSYNADQANSANTMNGLFSLAGNGAMLYALGGI